jgi:hypothetical protein
MDRRGDWDFLLQSVLKTSVHLPALQRNETRHKCFELLVQASSVPTAQLRSNKQSTTCKRILNSYMYKHTTRGLPEAGLRLRDTNSVSIVRMRIVTIPSHPHNPDATRGAPIWRPWIWCALELPNIFRLAESMQTISFHGRPLLLEEETVAEQ